MNKEVEEAKRTFNSYIHAIETFGTIDYKCINNLYNPAIILLNYIQELENQNMNLIQEKIISNKSVEPLKNFYDYYNVIPKQKIRDKIEELEKKIIEHRKRENLYAYQVENYIKKFKEELLNEEE